MERVQKKWRNKSKKWQREEEEHWELKGVKNKDGELNQLGRGNRKVKKKEKVRSKHKFKSFKWKQAEMSTSHFF